MVGHVVLEICSRTQTDMPITMLCSSTGGRLVNVMLLVVHDSLLNIYQASTPGSLVVHDSLLMNIHQALTPGSSVVCDSLLMNIHKASTPGSSVVSDSLLNIHQASTPGSSAAGEGQGYRGLDHDQSREVLVHDEAVNSGPAGVNYRVSFVTTISYSKHHTECCKLLLLLLLL